MYCKLFMHYSQNGKPFVQLAMWPTNWNTNFGNPFVHVMLVRVVLKSVSKV